MENIRFIAYTRNHNKIAKKKNFKHTALSKAMSISNHKTTAFMIYNFYI